jgi:glycosyltransferase involved in cell wall biosynthesis
MTSSPRSNFGKEQTDFSDHGSQPRVAFVTNIVPPYRKTFYEKLCANPRYAWCLLHGFTLKEDGRPDYRGPLAVPEEHVKNVELRFGPYTLRWQQGVLKGIQRFDPHLLVLLGISGTLSNWLLIAWAKLHGRKIIIWACGWEPQRRGSFAARLKHLLARVYFSLANRCLLYSTKGLRYVADLGVPRDRLAVCYNGIEIDHLLDQKVTIRQEAEELRSSMAPHAHTVFLYVGGMIQEKRIDLLLEAFARVEKENPGTVLWLVGDGPDREKFETDCRFLNISNARFLGRIIGNVDKYFAAADFLVLPGLGGLAFNQAMFWGTPCITSEADGTEDDLVIDGVTGRRFITGSRDSLECAIRDCINTDEFTRQAWGARCRELILERSNVTTMVAVFHDSIDELLLRGKYGKDAVLNASSVDEHGYKRPD